MKFHEMVFTIQIDHQVIGGFMNSIDRSTYRDARKKLLILKQLLTNHFLVEEFVLYPFIRKKINSGERVGPIGRFDDDTAEWLREMEKQESACTTILALLSDCLNCEESAFRGMFAKAVTLIEERIHFEEIWLLSGVDTSKTRLLRKSDFARLRIEE
ncbi:MAG: hypothetical protein H7837_06765 [Magnetococcus sp. MYC-9]